MLCASNFAYFYINTYIDRRDVFIYRVGDQQKAVEGGVARWPLGKFNDLNDSPAGLLYRILTQHCYWIILRTLPLQ